MSHCSWFAVEGSLEPVGYDGPSFFRFPESVAAYVIERYSAPGDWVIDPFSGFGTTLVVAERLGRHDRGAIGADRRRGQGCPDQATVIDLLLSWRHCSANSRSRR